MKITVIDVLARSTGKRYSTFDVVGAGPRHIAGIAENYGEVRFLPYEKFENGLNEILTSDVAMISAMSTDIIALKNLILKLKRRGFRGILVAGGPISFEYLKVLSETSVDYVVIGEGEIPVSKLLESLARGERDVSHVPALAYRESGGIKITSRHVYTPKEVLAKIKPWTRVDEAYEHPQIYRFYVEVLRGCSNFHRPRLKELGCISCEQCTSPILHERLSCPAGIPPGCGFCSVPYAFGYPRSRPVSSIVKEVEELIAHGARRVVLSAPDFLDYMRETLVESEVLTDPCQPPPNVDAIEGLLNSLYSIEATKNGKAVIMIENIKACLVNEEVGKVLGRYLKGTTVHIGLETSCDFYNETVLGKPIGFKHVLTACRILSDNGLRPYVYIMHGLPLATKKVYEETARSVKRLQETGVEKITLYKFINLPYTAFEKLPPSYAHRRYIAMIKKLIDMFNMKKKKELVGKTIEAYLMVSGQRIYGYPVKHGPVIFVRSTELDLRNLNGCRALVKISNVKPRYVIGTIAEILEC